MLHPAPPRLADRRASPGRRPTESGPAVKSIYQQAMPSLRLPHPSALPWALWTCPSAARPDSSTQTWSNARGNLPAIWSSALITSYGSLGYCHPPFGVDGDDVERGERVGDVVRATPRCGSCAQSC